MWAIKISQMCHWMIGCSISMTSYKTRTFQAIFQSIIQRMKLFPVHQASFSSVSKEKIKAGMFDGPQI